jgi:transcriptional/translational regulatory protein YebC/TACO1
MVIAASILDFIFERKSRFNIPAEEIEKENDVFEVFGPIDSFRSIQEKLQEISITPDEAGLIRVPVSYKNVDDEEALKQFDKLIGLLEDDEDVVTVYHNLESEA